MGAGCGEVDSRNQEEEHGVQILVVLLCQPCGGHECEDNDGTEDHSKELSLENREFEALNDDVVESPEAGCGQSGADLDQHVAVGLGVTKSLLELVRTENPVLKTSLVGSDTLNHELLILFREALSAHGRVGEPVEDEQAPEEGDAAVSDENSLP